ncbi:hypothetical protein [Amnibacterium endophyticum]|uniref:Uncharacterized protein n=1 Tax=Amnibacterium endophyticum TaxID=2109337 RepID=A0ABW4LGS2_9MICO
MSPDARGTTGVDWLAPVTDLPSAEPLEPPLHGTEEWLSTLDDPHDTTRSERHDLPGDEGLLEHDNHDGS